VRSFGRTQTLVCANALEDLPGEQGVAVSYETVRRRVNHLGPIFAAQAPNVTMPSRGLGITTIRSGDVPITVLGA
jgi:hypothetical protein